MIRKFPDLVEVELMNARRLHPRPMNSLHEGFAVLLEEVDELKAEVWRKQRDRIDVLRELIQIATVAQRIAEECL